MIFFKKNKEPQNIKQVLNYLKSLEKELNITSKELKELKEKSKLCFQKMEIIRYNPFSGTGGDQSFTIALLDENNNGMVITSIYSRDGNRVYAKPIKNGASEYGLSNEEKTAIKKAINP